MVYKARVSLSENQIELLQQSLEYLHTIKDWQLLTEAIVIEGVKQVGGGKGLFLVYDFSLKQLIPQASLNLDKREKKSLIGSIQSIIERKKSRRYFRENNTYFFPITRQQEFSGVLVIEPYQEENLTNEQINLINIFMQSVSVILENSRLFLIMQRKSKSLTYINQLHQLLNQYTFQEIIAEMVEKVGELLHSEMAGIMLFDPEKNELALQKPAFGVWEDSIIKQYRIPLNENSNAKQVFLTGIPTITLDARQDNRYNQHFINLFKASTLITVPLLVDNKRIGIIHAINKKHGYFTEDDLNLLLDIADQLGVILKAAIQQAAGGNERYKRFKIEGYLINQLFDLVINMTEEKLQETKYIMNTLGISLFPRICVVKIGFFGKSKWVKDKLRKYEPIIISEIKKVLKNSCAIYRDGTVAVLYPHETETNLTDLCSLLQNNLQKKISKEDQEIEVLIGIGESMDSLEFIGRSYQQAGQILAVLPDIQHIGRVGYYPACGIYTLLSSITTHDTRIAHAYTDMYLSKLNKIKDSKEMKETLQVYLKHNGQIKKTAEELFIHQNTLKYRIDKILDTTGYDLTDSEVRLNLNLALRLEQMLYG
jgi:sugar diacid utilization regulator/GAF domain-containing protein